MFLRGAAKLCVFGVPSSAGARGPGVERAPFALREAGLLEGLRATGARVVNLSDLSLFPWQADPEHPRARNLPIAACAARASADEMGRALAEGFTLVLGGDCSLLAGTAAGTRQALGEDVGVVFVDANADLNTPETSPSGQLNGMALALALGRGPAALAALAERPGVASPKHVALVGYRELDSGEVAPAGELALALTAADVRARGARAAAEAALDALPTHSVFVHCDVDVLDAEVMPAKDTLTPGRGLTWAEAETLVSTLVASPRVVGLQLTEFNPSLDPDGALARQLVALLAQAVSARMKGA
jgi:arginase